MYIHINLSLLILQLYNYKNDTQHSGVLTMFQAVIFKSDSFNV